VAIAGRSMPGRVFNTKRAIDISAPVLPAETAACARPALICSIATRREESFLLRMAEVGASSISTTWDAGTSSMRAPNVRRKRTTSASITAGCPTAKTEMAGRRRKNASIAGRVTCGP
jgi:hypothetical protein